MLAMERADRVAGAMVGAATDPQPGRPWAPARRIPIYMLIGELDFAIDNARQTAQRLQQAGHRVELNVIPGARHGGYLRGHDPAIWAFLTGG